MIALLLNRHVIKYILGRKVGWHDLAFFDPVMYESLRQLVLDTEIKDGSSMFSSLDLTFCVEMSPEEVSYNSLHMWVMLKVTIIMPNKSNLDQFSPMLFMYNAFMVSIGQFTVGLRAFKTARKIREVFVFSFCKDTNLSHNTYTGKM
jgi:hypothetical protein